MGAPTSHAAVTLWIVPCRLGHCLSGLTGINMRHDDALYAPVQKTQDGRILMVRNARDRGDAKYFGSAHHVFYLVQVHRTMLTVDHDKVVADGPKQFHEVWGVAADDGAEHNLALGQFCLCGVGTHSAPVLLLSFLMGGIRCTQEALCRRCPQRL